MSLPENQLNYAMGILEDSLKNEGIDPNEGNLKIVMEDYLNELYNSGDKEFAKYQEHCQIVQITGYPEKFIADASEIKRKLPVVPVDGKIRDLIKIGVSIAITIYNEDGTIDNNPLNEFDLLVYQSICSYIDRGIGNDDTQISDDVRFFTPKMIFENMNPDLGDGEAKTRLIQNVKNSIEKMSRTHMTLEYDKFIEKKYKGKKNESTRHEFLEDARITGTRLITLDRYDLLVNGEWVQGYKIITVPPIYWKQKTMVKQLATYERKLLSPPALRDKSGEMLLIKHFLLEHIQDMKNSPKLSRKLKYDTIFDRTGYTLEGLTRAQRYNKRKQIKKYLDFLVSEGNITGYSEYKSGQSIVGIQFKL